MFRGDNHHKQKVTHADVLKTSTDGDMTGDPSLYRLRSHVASPVSHWIGG